MNIIIILSRILQVAALIGFVIGVFFTKPFRRSLVVIGASGFCLLASVVISYFDNSTKAGLEALGFTLALMGMSWFIGSLLVILKYKLEINLRNVAIASVPSALIIAAGIMAFICSK